MTVYTQPALDLAPAPTAEPTWADVLTTLNKAGVRFTRNPDTWRSSMECYSAAWWGSRYFDDGSYVHIHVYLYRRVMNFRCQFDAQRMDHTGGKGLYDRPLYQRGARALLHDPAPAEALAALATVLDLEESHG